MFLCTRASVVCVYQAMVTSISYSERHFEWEIMFPYIETDLHKSNG